ncbi:hypothetical protein [Rhodococcoides kroppenstedtii]|uniref:hypothetical protein n=1 Tax=Rhodococcoides kroppenstedtii TaxID=293050 RepID=UPI001BDED612|nr:hypothetical protein [Rhodococcus kroppenstedtii]MBT1191113.1 hypothetical protein [Rhodococcus kroppenstedtii]
MSDPGSVPPNFGKRLASAGSDGADATGARLVVNDAVDLSDSSTGAAEQDTITAAVARIADTRNAAPGTQP